MEMSRDIGRGHHDAEVFALFLECFVTFYLKIPALFPELVVVFFDLFGIVDVLFGFAHYMLPLNAKR
jgi:hypothetical protein